MVGQGTDLSVDSAGRVNIVLCHHVGIVEAAEDIHNASTVPIVGNSAAVIDMTSGVLEDLHRTTISTIYSRHRQE